MKQSTVVALFEKLFASGWTSPDITVIWHAGEPLVVPIEFYQTAFEAIEALRPAPVKLHHTIQTNGMLMTPAWCDLFRRWNVGIGVSVDGPRHIHDVHRVTRSGRGTFDRTIEGIRMLRREGIPFHVISVLSAAGMSAPGEMLDFYLAEQIENVCFNVEESEGGHTSELFALGDARTRFRDFLQSFWTLARRTGRINFIREVDGMLPRVFRPAELAMTNGQVEPFAMLNVDCRGNVSSFSPELLGLKHPDYGDFIIGNIVTDSLEQMAASGPMVAMTRDIGAGVTACRRGCEYFSVCGGGAPVNKLTENGSFDSERTQFCTLTQMVPIDLILDAFERLNETMGEADPAQVVATIGRHATATSGVSVSRIVLDSERLRSASGEGNEQDIRTSERGGVPDRHVADRGLRGGPEKCAGERVRQFRGGIGSAERQHG